MSDSYLMGYLSHHVSLLKIKFTGLNMAKILIKNKNKKYKGWLLIKDNNFLGVTYLLLVTK